MTAIILLMLLFRSNLSKAYILREKFITFITIGQGGRVLWPYNR